MVRYFRCLQEKEARQTAHKAVQKGRRKKREEGRGPGAGLGSDRPGWPGRASTPTSGSDHRRGKFGSRKGRIRAVSPAGRWDRARGPCETDDVTRAEFRRLGGPTGQGGSESGDKITERVECSSGRGRGGKESFIVAKRRGDAMPDRAS
jgi:hypothetical protein